MKTDPKATGQRGSKKAQKNSKSKSAEQKKVTDDIWSISRLPAENPNPIMRLTPEGKVLYANDASLALLDSWQQELGQTLPNNLQSQLKETFAAGVKQQIELEEKNRVLSCTLVPVPDGGYVNFYGNDITEQKAAEQERNHLLQREQAERAQAEQAQREAEQAKVSAEAELSKRIFAETALGKWTDKPLPQQARPLWLRYGMAAVATFIAILIRQILDPILGNSVQVTSLFGAIAFSVWYGGIGPALFAAIFGYLGLSWLLLDWRNVLTPTLAHLTSLGVFLISSMTIMALGEAMRRAQRQAHQSAQVAVEQRRQAEVRLLEQQRIEEALRESERKFSLIFHNLPFAAALATRQDATIVDVNIEFERSFGYSKTEALGKSAQELGINLNSQLRAYLFEQLEKYGFVQDLEVELFSRSGEKRLFLANHNVVRMDDQQYILTTMQDITERKQVEEQVRGAAEFDAFRVSLLDTLRPLSDPLQVQSEALRLVGEYLQVDRVLYAENDENNETILIADNYVNGIAKLTGRIQRSDFESSSQILNSGEVLNISNIQNAPNLSEKDCTSFAALSAISILGVPIHKDGRWIASLGAHQSTPRNWSENEIAILREAAERIWSALERARAQQALERERAVFQRLFDTMPVMVSMYDPETNSTQMNAELERISGWKTEEVTVVSLLQSLYPDPDYLKEVLARMAAAVGKNEWMEVHVQTRDGRTVDSLWSNISIMDGEKIIKGVALGIDITERKRAETSLAKFAREQVALFQLTDQLQRADSVDQIYDAALDAILNSLQCDRASILLTDEADVMHFAAWRGLSDEYRKFTDGHSPWTPDTKDPQPVFYNDIATSDLDDGLKAVIKAEGICSLAFIPLVSGGKLIGKFMTYFNDLHQFTESELDLSLTVARQLTFGIERERAEDRLQSSNERLRLAVAAGQIGIWDIDLIRRDRTWSKEGKAIYGLGPDEYLDFARQLELTHPDDRAYVEQSVQAFRDDGTIKQLNLEHRIVQPDGSLRWVEVRGEAVYEDEPLPVRLIGTIVDITERKRMEEVLRQKDELLTRVTDETPILLARNSRDLRYLYVNRTLAEFLGSTSEAMIGKSIREFIGEAALETILPYVERVLQGERVEFETEIPYATAGRHFMHIVYVPDHDQTGAVVGWYATVTDITERKRIEQEVERNRQWLHQVIETVQSTIAIFDVNGKNLMINSAGAKGLGMKPEEVIGKTIFDLMPPEFAEQRLQQFHDIVEGGQIREYDLEVPGESGSRWYHASVAPMFDAASNETILVSASLDITERKEAERRLILLANISELLRKIEDPGDLMYAVSHAVGDHLRVKRALFNEIDLVNDVEIVHRDYCRGVPSVAGIHKVTDYSGVTTEEIASGKTIVNNDSKTDPRTAADYERSYESTGERAYIAVPMLREGRWVASLWVSDDVPRQWNKEEVALLESIAERTWAAIERIRNEQALQETEELFSKAFHVSPILKMIVQADTGQIVDINSGNAKAFEYTRETAIGKVATEIIRLADEAARAGLIAQMKAEEHIYNAEVVLRTHSGKLRTAIFNAEPITLHGVKHYLFTLMDITERKQAEEALRASEELYRAIARSIPNGGVYVVDKDLRYQVAEGVVMEVFGLSREKLEGHLMTELFSEAIVQRMQDRYTQTMAGEIVGYETERNGHTYWSQHAPLADGSGREVIVTLDITERKEAEEKLKQSEERFARFMQHLPGLAWIKDTQGHYVYANDAAVKAFSAPRENLYGKTDREVFPPEVADQYQQNDHRAVNEGAGIEVVETLQQADGILHSSLVNKFPIPGADGNIALIGGIAIDITERIRAEEALRTSEERMRLAIEANRMVAWEWDPKQDRVITSDNFAEIYGLPSLSTAAEGYGLIWPEDLPPHRAKVDRITRQGGEYESEFRITRPVDGRVLWMEERATAMIDTIGRVTRLVGVVTDITERKHAEEELRRSEERERVRATQLEAIMEAVPAAIWVAHDPDCKLVTGNRASYEILQIPAGVNASLSAPEGVQPTNFEVLHEGKVLKPEELPVQRAARGTEVRNYEEQVRFADGSSVYLFGSAITLRDERNNPTGALAAFVDITARKQAEQALKELNLELEERVLARTAELRSTNERLQDEIEERAMIEEALRESNEDIQKMNQRLLEEIEERAMVEEALRESDATTRLILDTSPDAIVIANKQGRIMNVNAQIKSLFGYEATEVLGKPVETLIPQRFHERHIKHRASYSAHPHRRSMGVGLELFGQRQDGTEFPVDVMLTPIQNQNISDWETMITIRDSTERKRLEAEIRENQKRLQILSQRIVEVQEEERRAIARELHDRVGQSLAALSLNLTIINNQLVKQANEQVSERMSDSIHLTKEVIALVRDVMANLRPAVLDDYGLEVALKANLDDLKSRYGLNTKFDKSDIPIARLNPSIEMTLLRITQEAFLNIVRHARADQVTLSLGQADATIRLIVEDNGVGIKSFAEANRPGSHGLTIMRERAEAVGGHLRVSTAAPRGTKIEVTVPFQPRGQKENEK